ELSADPMVPELTKALEGMGVGRPETYRGQLKSILSNANIFGIDLYEAGIGETVEEMFREEAAGPGAVRAVLKKYLNA
ncbi:MAG: mannitol dehydrogenase family protein, partial [Enterocloster clostridioformis]|nr:mannitol dehydrogenase family protein [Enterocloster clostridioformis]